MGGMMDDDVLDPVASSERTSRWPSKHRSSPPRRKDVLLRSIVPGFLFALLSLSPVVGFAQQQCGPVRLQAPIPGSEQTEVLVLATPHLQRIEDLDRSTLRGLLDVLERWAPDVIGIEELPSEDIAAMKPRADLQPVLQAFAGPALTAADISQRATGLGWEQAAEKADSLLATLESAPESERSAIRGRLVVLLAAAYQPFSAALQLAYLEDDGDEAVVESIPDSLQFVLHERLDADSEEAAIGLELARRLGLQWIHPIDDHFDKATYLEIAEELQAELEKTDTYRNLVASGALEVSTVQLRESHARGDLWSHYQEINRATSQADDVNLQWRFFFETRLPSGLDRARVAMWEERNLGIAANVRKMTAFIPGGRALVVIGASHKPFLDAYLSCAMDVSVVHLEEIG